MKVFLDSIGCRLNQSEIEKLAGRFRAAGHEIVDHPAEADVVVVNTCAVTAEAASDSRQKVRQAARAGAAQIAVTGCWATLDPLAAAALPGVRWTVPNPRKDELLREILPLLHDEIDLEPLARQPLPGVHLRTRAFIKAQDGCDNFCTFCVTRLARGKGRSLPAEEILRDIRAAEAGGTREIVLTGVHLGSWGQDFEKPTHLRELIELILAKTSVARVRLSSLEPWDLPEGFFSLWQDERLCRHLHLPLQSGSAATLRRMARKTTPQSFAGLVATARQAYPEIAITTDLIVGFPGESEDEFAESLAFVQRIDFAAGHVFSFSPRPGTPAAHYSGQVPPGERKKRSALMRAVLAESGVRYRLPFVGQTLGVLWEASRQSDTGAWQMEGLTSNYLRVSAPAHCNLWNEISQVRLVGAIGDGLQGQILN